MYVMLEFGLKLQDLCLELETDFVEIEGAETIRCYSHAV